MCLVKWDIYCVYSVVLKPTNVLNILLCAVAQIINYIHNRNVTDDTSYWFVYSFSQKISYMIIINYKYKIINYKKIEGGYGAHTYYIEHVLLEKAGDWESG